MAALGYLELMDYLGSQVDLVHRASRVSEEMVASQVLTGTMDFKVNLEIEAHQVYQELTEVLEDISSHVTARQRKFQYVLLEHPNCGMDILYCMLWAHPKLMAKI
jgi:hypothetical protein